MKVLKKRAIAILIDSFILASFLVLLQWALNNFNINTDNFDFLIVLLIFIRDFVFRNASIGKKILGLKIYNNDWKAPSFWLLFKRSVLVLTVGQIFLWKAKFVDGSVINFFDFEREKLGTRVIDKKIYKELKAEAESQEGDFNKNMTELYNAYLRNLYIK